MDLVQEKDYEIVRTEEKVLVIAIEKKAGLPHGAQLFYDGGNHALLLRTVEDGYDAAPALKSGRFDLIEAKTKSAVIIDFLPDDVKNELRESDHVVIVEINKEKNHVARSYEAKVVGNGLQSCIETWVGDKLQR